LLATIVCNANGCSAAASLHRGCFVGTQATAGVWQSFRNKVRRDKELEWKEKDILLR